MKGKKLLMVLLSLCLCACLAVSFGCKKKHEHSFATEWTKDSEYHWHACSGCEEVSEKTQHDWNDGEVTTQATATTKGVKTYACKVCSQTKTEDIDALGPQNATVEFKSSYNPSKTYDGNAVATPTASDYEKSGNGTVTFEWYKGTTKLTSAPKDAGDYKVKVIVAESPEFKSASAEKTFTIAKADGTLSFAETYSLNKAYDDVAVATPTAEDYITNSEGAVTFEWYKGTTKLESAPKDAGDYKVKVLIAESNNHKSISAEKTFTITKAYGTLSFKQTYSLDKTYDGTAVATPTAENYITNSDGAVTVEWYKGATKLASAPTDAGDYKVKVLIAESNNHKSISAEKTFTITKAYGTLSFKQTYSLDKTYDGTAVATPTAENYITNSDGAVTVEWYKGATKLASAPTDAGDYKVKVLIAESNNYKGVSGDKNFSISKKAVTVSFSGSNNNYSFEYNGTEKSIEVYTVSGFVTGDANPSASATGDRVNVTTEGFDVIVALNVTAGKENNYTLPESASLTQNYKITPKTVSITNIEVGDKSYNGKTDAVINDYQTVGILADDETYVDVGFTSATFAQAEIGQNISVNIAITLSGTRAKNYVLSSSTLTATANIVESVHFVIIDEFTVGGNTVVTGTLVSGIIYVGDTLVFDGVSGVKTVTVHGIEIAIGHQTVPSISSEYEGEFSLLLGGITKAEITDGDNLVSENSNMFKVVSFTANVYFLTKNEGGRHVPVLTSLTPTPYSAEISCGLYKGTATLVSVTGNEDSEYIYPGETVIMALQLVVPGYVEIGDEFTLREGTKTVANGTINGIEQVSISSALLGAVSLGGINKTYNFVNIPEGVKEIAINGISFAASTNCYFLYDTTKATCTVTKVSDSTTVSLNPTTGGEMTNITLPTDFNVVFTNITAEQFELTIKQMAR